MNYQLTLMTEQPVLSASISELLVPNPDPKWGVRVPSSGPQPSLYLIIGDAPGKEDEKQVKMFTEKVGSELTKMLNDAGIMRTECRVTNLCKYRPPYNIIENWSMKKKKTYKQFEKDLLKLYKPLRDKFVDPRIYHGYQELILEIEATKPNIIIPLGNMALWAVTGRTGILDWRSSLLEVDTEEMRSVLL
jgi:uracil-DNA glycosylase